MTGTFTGSYNGHDLNGVKVQQFGKDDALKGHAGGLLEFTGSTLDAITFDPAYIKQLSHYALLTVIHEFIHAAFVKKYPFMQTGCDPDAGPECAEFCTDPDANFQELAKTGGDLDCFDCQLCSEQHAYCGAALTACCLAADCLENGLTDDEKNKLRGTARIGAEQCSDWMDKGEDACSECETSGVSPPVPDVPATTDPVSNTGCYPLDEDASPEDQQAHAELCEACNDLKGNVEADP